MHKKTNQEKDKNGTMCETRQKEKKMKQKIGDKIIRQRKKKKLNI